MPMSLARYSGSLRITHDRFNPSPSTLICIYEHADSAAAVIRQTPLQIQIPSSKSITEPITSVASMNILNAFKTLEPEPATRRGRWTTATKTSPAQGDDCGERGFVLSAHVSRVNHASVMDQKEFSWGFRMPTRNQAQAILARELPEQGMAPVAADQRTVPARIVAREMKSVAKLEEELKSRLRG
ncbi:MAG: hypothetical protein Q9162_006692 [Coniocarpon cinnabarinum]